MLNYPVMDASRLGLSFYGAALASSMQIMTSAGRLSTIFSPFPIAAAQNDIFNHLDATGEMIERSTRVYAKPEFGLTKTTIDGQPVAVQDVVVEAKPYCNLRHFERDTSRNDPKVLLVAPMSGHHATLLRGTVNALLPDHDVYITDWNDAKNVPVSEGEFGFDDYVQYVQDFIHHLGPNTHVIAVCQPTVPVLAAISLMAQNNETNQPLSVTVMGGPIDTRSAQTEVTALALKHPLSDFKNNVTATVPAWYDGAGQPVYPGMLQLAGFMAMNPDKHYKSHINLFKHLVNGDMKAEDIKEFYDEYMAVADLPAKFYIETVDQVFQRQTFARGIMEVNGQLVDPSKIKNTILMTVEGEKDDISAPHQTIAAHRILSGLAPDMHFNHLQEGAGHYGIFNGRRWENEIKPRIAAVIREAGKRNGLEYSPVPQTALISPTPWHIARKRDYIKPVNDNAPVLAA